MKKSRVYFLFSLVYSVFVCSTAHAHFGMVIPSSNTVNQQKKNIDIALSFSHPFEGIGMDLAKPKKFYVIADGVTTDLLPSLRPAKVMNHKAWTTRQQLPRPGVYHYIMEPEPYWESSEDIYIIHYSKSIVAAYGDDENWDMPANLPTEIIPLLRPYGNYAGNSFTGKVLMNGKAVAGSEVEVEFYNQGSAYSSASDYHITQVIKADSKGIFHFTCPLAGWWGFSALNEADFTIEGPDGTAKNVELGAVLWIYFDSFQKRK